MQQFLKCKKSIFTLIEILKDFLPVKNIQRSEDLFYLCKKILTLHKNICIISYVNRKSVEWIHTKFMADIIHSKRTGTGGNGLE